MLKKLLLVFFFFLVSFPLIFSVNVDIITNVGEVVSTVEYNFYFEEDESYSSFSFEKPRDARIVSISSSSSENIPYSVAGDFFIFRPENTKNTNLTIKFESNLLSTEIFNKGSFSFYVNFNIPIVNLTHSLFFEEQNLKSILDVFPREYLIREEKLIWSINDVSSDLLFLVNLNIEQNFQESNDFSYYFLVLLLLIPILLFLVLFYFIRKNNNETQKEEEEKPHKEKIKTKEKQEVQIEPDLNIMISSQEEQVIDSKEDIEVKFNEFIGKYLTKNEMEVVKIIKTYEGISQFDILNHLPLITKSNLSKIISKLDSKKILKRIKVGKVNKIYLGEKLIFASNIEKNE